MINNSSLLSKFNDEISNQVSNVVALKGLPLLAIVIILIKPLMGLSK